MTTNKFDLIVFDLDGTLLQTIEDIAHSYRLACKEFGFPLPPTEEVTLWVGQGHDVAVSGCFSWLKRQLEADKSLFPKLTLVPNYQDLSVEDLYNTYILPEREAFKTRHHQLYIEVGNTHAKVFPGVYKVLAQLKAQGVVLAVLTNKIKALTPQVLRDAKLDSYFSQVFSDGDLQQNKPAPEGILRLIEQFNVADKSRVLMVGDSENDVKAGLAAQVQVLGLTYGYNYGRDIAASHPTYVADHFTAVLALNQGLSLDSEAYRELVKTYED